MLDSRESGPRLRKAFEKETKAMNTKGLEAIRFVCLENGATLTQVNLLVRSLKPVFGTPDPLRYNQIRYSAVVGEEDGKFANWNADVLFVKEATGRKPVKVTLFYTGNFEGNSYYYEKVLEKTIDQDIPPAPKISLLNRLSQWINE